MLNSLEAYTRYYPLDPEIEAIVKRIRRMGYETVQSCSGHNGSPTYITFSKGNLPDFPIFEGYEEVYTYPYEKRLKRPNTALEVYRKKDMTKHGWHIYDTELGEAVWFHTSEAERQEFIKRLENWVFTDLEKKG